MVLLVSSGSFACSNEPQYNEDNDFKITDVSITYNEDLKIMVWEIKVEGKAGGTTPTPAGQLNGAPVLGYPGMPMYMDSPGFQVVTQNNTISVVVPGYRMNHQTDFNYDGVTAFMEVNTEMNGKPMLGVYEVYSVASGDLSLPYSVKTH